MRGRGVQKRPRCRAVLGPYGPPVTVGLAQAAEDEVAQRIWQRDVTLWPGASDAKQLGWLDAPERMNETFAPLQAFAEEVRREGFERVLLLGVGAPHLALELIRRTFAQAEGYLALSALASTDADAVLTEAKRLDPATLLIVADKVGGALETRTLFSFFSNYLERELGAEGAGRRFAAVGNPGDSLAALASEHRVRTAFLNDPDVPGCYAALSLCGLLPAALAGVDVSALQRHARVGAAACRAEPKTNAGVWLGTVLGVLAGAGRDKVTFVLPEELAGLGAWLERLLAEATGKEGVGIVPVIGEPLGAPEVYGDDRVFVRFELDGATSAPHAPLQQLETVGHPTLHLTLPSPYAVSEQLFVWQFVAAVAAYQLGVNPFDQSEVAEADTRTQHLMAHYAQTHTMPDTSAAVSAETLAVFLSTLEPGDYVALQAYLPPSQEVTASLERLRVALRDRFRVAVTCAFGPHYLHSTGQLHKGGKGGHVVQLVSEPRQNAPIPPSAGEPPSFYTLKRAQALGDKQALEAAGRRVIGFNLGQRVVAGLEVLSRLS